MVSAWSAKQNLVLGQVKVADKSNEITAIPRLLDLLTIKGAIVTIDAMRWVASAKLRRRSSRSRQIMCSR
jgi:predicted transposase YbfD/YdcC